MSLLCFCLLNGALASAGWLSLLQGLRAGGRTDGRANGRADGQGHLAPFSRGASFVSVNKIDTTIYTWICVIIMICLCEHPPPLKGRGQPNYSLTIHCVYMYESPLCSCLLNGALANAGWGLCVKACFREGDALVTDKRITSADEMPGPQ